MGKTEGASNRDMLTVKKKDMFIFMAFLYTEGPRLTCFLGLGKNRVT